MSEIGFENLELLSSRQNKTLKEAISLKITRQAKKHGLMLLEGLRQVSTALQAMEGLCYILFSDNEEGLACFTNLQETFHTKKHPELFVSDLDLLRRVDSKLFKEITDTEEYQGIIAVFKAPTIASLAQVDIPKQGRYLALEDCRDPGNLGAIIRTVEALNLDGLILLADYVWPYNCKSLRAAMGSALFLNIYQASDVEELRRFSANLDFISADLSGENLSAYSPEQSRNGFILLLGNEAHGLSPEAKSAVDFSLHIAMGGKAESLNLAASAAIMAWALREKYK